MPNETEAGAVGQPATETATIESAMVEALAAEAAAAEVKLEDGEGTDGAAKKEAEKKEEPAAEAKPADADPELTKRLARLASAQRHLDEQRAAFKAERQAAGKAATATSEAAANWQKLQDAKTKGEALAALDMLFSAEEIEGALYEKLTDRIYAKQNGQGMTQAEVDARIAKGVAEAEAARVKADADAKEAAAKEIQEGYVSQVVTAYDPAKYPAIDAHGVSGDQILTYAEAYFRAHKTAATPDELLAYVDKDLRAKAERIVGKQAVATTAAGKPASTSTVTAKDKSDAPPVTSKKKLTPEEAMEEALREAGV